MNKAENIYYAEYRYPRLYPWLNSDDESNVETQIIKEYIRTRLEYLDINREITLNNYRIHEKKLELIQGLYGERAQVIAQKLQDDMQMVVASGLVKNQKGPSIMIYKDIVLTLLGQGALYQNSEDKSILYLYIGKRYSLEDMEIINLCNILFLPWGYKVKIYWDKELPVLGEDSNRIGYVIL